MIKQALIVLSFLLCLITFLFYISQRRLIYFPTQTIPKLQDYHATDMTQVTLQTKDHLALASWYKPATNHQPTVLFLHGNAGNIGGRMPLARVFLNKGLGVLLLEYRGYGGNPGSPTEQGLYEDAGAALRFLQSQGVTTKHVVLYGESLGTGVATELAAKHPVCALILQSPFTSLVSVARYHYPWLLVKPRDTFDSLARMKRIHAPLLVLHGKQDPVVPFQEGLTVYHAANQPKKMWAMDGKHHNDLWSTPGFSAEILGFVQTNCSNEPISLREQE